MAVDVKGHRLFVPGENQRTIEVVDLRAGKVMHTITGFGGDPRKTLYLPQTNEIWVDDGDATCKAFSGDSYAWFLLFLNPRRQPSLKQRYWFTMSCFRALNRPGASEHDAREQTQ